MELWGSGCALQELPQKRYGDRELWRRAARVVTWRRRRRHRGIGALEMRCSLIYAAGVASKEVWSSSVS